jgi:hypothetical protein
MHARLQFFQQLEGLFQAQPDSALEEVRTPLPLFRLTDTLRPGHHLSSLPSAQPDLG